MVLQKLPLICLANSKLAISVTELETGIFVRERLYLSLRSITGSYHRLMEFLRLSHAVCTLPDLVTSQSCASKFCAYTLCSFTVSLSPMQVMMSKNEARKEACFWRLSASCLPSSFTLAPPHCCLPTQASPVCHTYGP